MSDLVPDGWEIKTLDKEIDILSGFPFQSSLFVDDSSNIGLIRIRDIQKQQLKTFYEGKYEDIYVVKKGDILVGMDGDFNITKWKINNALLNQRICKVSARSNSEFDSNFLFHFLEPELKVINNITVATTVKHLSVKDLRGITKPFPPLPEQQKIAAILTSVDEVIEKTAAQIAKLKDLKTAMMQELLTRGVGVDGKPHTEFKDSPVGRIPKGWDVESFEDVFSLKNGVNKGKEFFGIGGPIISYRNVFDGNGIYDSMLTNKVDLTESELNRFRVNYGDVFITRTSETADEIGYTNVYLGNRDDVVFNGFVIRARQKADFLDFEYCKYVFQSYSIRNQMILNSKFTTRAGISGESLNRILITIPPKLEQKAIAQSISSVDFRIQSLLKSKQAKVSLKKALMQDLLTGKVRVTLPSSPKASPPKAS